jgi:hypothetical protein
MGLPSHTTDRYPLPTDLFSIPAGYSLKPFFHQRLLVHSHLFWFVLKSALYGNRGGSFENLFIGWDGIGLEGIYSSFVCILNICLKEK